MEMEVGEQYLEKFIQNKNEDFSREEDSKIFFETGLFNGDLVKPMKDTE